MNRIKQPHPAPHTTSAIKCLPQSAARAQTTQVTQTAQTPSTQHWLSPAMAIWIQDEDTPVRVVSS
ncbi:MAG: hypothetical protein Q7U28_03865 [Aquabacterium sp.]|nr:hypothetical protein [Aquabacterium sp.]